MDDDFEPPHLIPVEMVLHQRQEMIPTQHYAAKWAQESQAECILKRRWRALIVTKVGDTENSHTLSGQRKR